MVQPSLLLGRFEIRRTLGEGGMGVVYEAYDREQERIVALKTLKKLSPQGLYLFKNEFRSLAGLRHPNLIRLYELFSEGDLWFFSMELLEGQDFLRFIKSESNDGASSSRTILAAPEDAPTLLDPPREENDAPSGLFSRPALFDEQRLREALRQLINALRALHEAGKVHRDIKPSNVMILEAGNGETPEKIEGKAGQSSGPIPPPSIPRLVLMDFGLVADSGTDEQHVIGTPYFMAPEQAAGQPVTPAGDWYSVGVMLFLALTGGLPFGGSASLAMLEKQRREAPAPSTLNDVIPADLDALCVALLRRRPEERPTEEQLLAWVGEPREAAHTKHKIFVGREAELTQLYQAFGESRARGRFLIVRGESGVGKSALVRFFLEQAPSRFGYSSLLLLKGRCYEREQVPYKALDGVIDMLSRWLLQRSARHLEKLFPRDARLLGRIFPVLRQLPGMSMTPFEEAEVALQDPQELRRRAFVALRRLLSYIAQRLPLVIWIDDLQWADADSLALLQTLLQSDDPPTLLLIGTWRGGPEEALPPSWMRLLPELLWVGALGQAEARALLRASSEDPSAEELERFVEEAAGHPLFLAELARQARQRGPRLPLTLDEILWRRISALSPHLRRLIELSSVAGSPLSLEVLGRIVQRPAGALRIELSDLQDAQLMRSSPGGLFETYHDRVRESVRSRLQEAPLRLHHKALAEALEATGANEPQALLHHFEAAGEPKRAARYALLAARRAEEALAFDQAVTFLQAALRLGVHWGLDRGALLYRLGEALAQAGRGPEAADAFLEAAQTASPQKRLECQSRAAEHLLGSGYIERGRAALSSVLSSIEERWPTSAARTLASLLWHRAQLRLRGLNWKERDEKELTPSELLRLDVYHAISLGLGPVDGFLAAHFQAKGLLWALKTGEPRRLARAMILEGIFISLEGGHRSEEAKALLDTARQIATRTQDPYLNCLVQTGEGIGHSAAGRFREAFSVLSGAQERFLQLSRVPTWEMNNTRIFRFLALRQMGLWRQIRRDLVPFLQDAERRKHRLAEATLIRTVAQLYLTQHEPAQALAAVERRPWPMPQSNYHAQRFNELLARVDIALYQGDAYQTHAALRSEFEALWGSLLLRMQIMRTEACWSRGRLVLAAARLCPKSERSAFLAEAEWLAAQLSWEKMPYATIWGGLLSAALSSLREQPEAAIERLRETLLLAQHNDTPICAEAARYRLSQLLSGEEGKAEKARAVQWLTAQEILQPERFIEIFAPGFGAPVR